jgi:hypothetical protein
MGLERDRRVEREAAELRAVDREAAPFRLQTYRQLAVLPLRDGIGRDVGLDQIAVAAGLVQGPVARLGEP